MNIKDELDMFLLRSQMRREEDFLHLPTHDQAERIKTFQRRMDGPGAKRAAENLLLLGPLMIRGKGARGRNYISCTCAVVLDDIARAAMKFPAMTKDAHATLSAVYRDHHYNDDIQNQIRDVLDFMTAAKTIADIKKDEARLVSYAHVDASERVPVETLQALGLVAVATEQMALYPRNRYLARLLVSEAADLVKKNKKDVFACDGALTMMQSAVGINLCVAIDAVPVIHKLESHPNMMIQERAALTMGKIKEKHPHYLLPSTGGRLRALFKELGMYLVQGMGQYPVLHHYSGYHYPFFFPDTDVSPRPPAVGSQPSQPLTDKLTPR